MIYKNDADIRAEFDGITITALEWRAGMGCGWVTMRFPNGGEHVCGGVAAGDEATTGFIVYDKSTPASSRVAFDHWFPESVATFLVREILTAKERHETSTEEYARQQYINQ